MQQKDPRRNSKENWPKWIDGGNGRTQSLLMSYDVSPRQCSPAFSVPDAIKAVRIKLDEDLKSHDRTSLSQARILELLSFGLNTTYFTYRRVIDKQKHGASSVAHNSKPMEGLEEIALRTAPTLPLQYGSDMWTIRLPWSTNTMSTSSLPTSTAWTATSRSQLSQSKMTDSPS